MSKILLFVIVLLSFSSVAFAAVIAGSAAPSFSAKNQDGKTVNLSDYSGKPVLLYFYPKDETPGCTKEACEFRDKFTEFKKQGAIILGVSRQDEKSHKEFIAKHNLPFDLLVDADGNISKSYGVGNGVFGLLKRQSVLIGRDGKVIKFYEDVDPKTHAGQVLQDMASAEKSK